MGENGAAETAVCDSTPEPRGEPASFDEAVSRCRKFNNLLFYEKNVTVPLETTVTICKDAALQARLAMSDGATYDDIKFMEVKKFIRAELPGFTTKLLGLLLYSRNSSYRASLEGVVVNCAWLAVHLASKGQTLLLDTLTQILKSDASVYMGSLNHDAVPEIRVNAIKIIDIDEFRQLLAPDAKLSLAERATILRICCELCESGRIEKDEKEKQLTLFLQIFEDAPAESIADSFDDMFLSIESICGGMSGGNKRYPEAFMNKALSLFSSDKLQNRLFAITKLTWWAQERANVEGQYFGHERFSAFIKEARIFDTLLERTDVKYIIKARDLIRYMSEHLKLGHDCFGVDPLEMLWKQAVTSPDYFAEELYGVMFDFPSRLIEFLDRTQAAISKMDATPSKDAVALAKSSGKTVPDKDAHVVAFLNMLGVFKKSICKNDMTQEFMAAILRACDNVVWNPVVGHLVGNGGNKSKGKWMMQLLYKATMYCHGSEHVYEIFKKCKTILEATPSEITTEKAREVTLAMSIMMAVVTDEEDFVAVLVKEATGAEDADGADVEHIAQTRARALCAAAVTQLEAYSTVATVEDVHDMLEFIASSRSFLPTPQSDILKRIFYIPFSVEKADQRFNFLKELDLEVQTRTFVFRELLCKMATEDPAKFNNAGFECFQKYFLDINQSIVCNQPQFGGGIVLVKCGQFACANQIWNILVSGSEDAPVHASKLKRQLFEKMQAMYKLEEAKQALAWVLKYLTSVSSQLVADRTSASERQFSSIVRLLNLLEYYLSVTPKPKNISGHGSFRKGFEIDVTITVPQDEHYYETPLLFKIPLRSQDTLRDLRRRCTWRMKKYMPTHSPYKGYVFTRLDGKRLHGENKTLGVLGIKADEAVTLTDKDWYDKTDDGVDDEQAVSHYEHRDGIWQELAKSNEMLTQLLLLLDLLPPSERSCRLGTWNFLMRMPTNQQRLGVFLQLDTPSADVDPDDDSGEKQLAWTKYLSNSTDFYNRLYCLQIVEMLLLANDTDTKVDAHAWRKMFLSLGGLQNVLDTFLQMQVPSVEDDAIRVNALATVLNIILFFHDPPSAKQELEEQEEKTEEKLELFGHMGNSKQFQGIYIKQGGKDIWKREESVDGVDAYLVSMHNRGWAVTNCPQLTGARDERKFFMTSFGDDPYSEDTEWMYFRTNPFTHQRERISAPQFEVRKVGDPVAKPNADTEGGGVSAEDLPRGKLRINRKFSMQTIALLNNSVDGDTVKLVQKLVALMLDLDANDAGAMDVLLSQEILHAALDILNSIARTETAKGTPAELLNITAESASNTRPFLQMLLRNPHRAARSKFKLLLSAVALSDAAALSAIFKEGLLRIFQIDVREATSECGEFFELMTSLMPHFTMSNTKGQLVVELEGKALDIESLIKTLLNKLAFESDAEEEIPAHIVNGVLRLVSAFLTILGTVSPDLQHDMKQCIMDDCLFRTPSVDDRRGSLCSDSQSRKLAFDLIRDLATKCPSTRKDFIETTRGLLADAKRFENHWNVSTEPFSARSGHSFCGLVNQGMTCYMNATLQQLFMNKDLRAGVMAASMRPRETPLQIIQPAVAKTVPTVATATVVPASMVQTVGPKVYPAVAVGTAKNLGKPKTVEKDEKECVRELQRTFAYLEQGVVGVFNPRPFVNSAVTLNLAHNVLEQNCAAEFLNALISRMGEIFKTGPGRQSLNSHFGGQMSYMTCRSSGYISGTSDRVNVIPINIRQADMVTPIESLDECLKYCTSTEEMKGDAQLVCHKSMVENWLRQAVERGHTEELAAVVSKSKDMNEEAEEAKEAGNFINADLLKAAEDKLQELTAQNVVTQATPDTCLDFATYEKNKANTVKVDGTRTSVFRDLPNTLAFHLQRFGMDVTDENFAIKKFNTKVEFPFEEDLDMFPYSYEGRKVSNDMDPEKLAQLKKNALYTLKGIVIHSGTLNSGHYYSLIKDNDGEWYEFNDRMVTKIRKSQIPTMAFGGYSIFQSYAGYGNRYTQEKRERFANAYMLFYSRKFPIPPPDRPVKNPPCRMPKALPTPQRTRAKQIFRRVFARPQREGRPGYQHWGLVMGGIKRVLQRELEATRNKKSGSERFGIEVYSANVRAVRQKQLFDPELLRFMLYLLKHIAGESGSGFAAELESASTTDIGVYFFRFFMSVVCHAKDKGASTQEWATAFEKYYQTHPDSIPKIKEFVPEIVTASITQWMMKRHLAPLITVIVGACDKELGMAFYRDLVKKMPDAQTESCKQYYKLLHGVCTLECLQSELLKPEINARQTLVHFIVGGKGYMSSLDRREFADAADHTRFPPLDSWKANEFYNPEWDLLFKALLHLTPNLDDVDDETYAIMQTSPVLTRMTNIEWTPNVLGFMRKHALKVAQDNMTFACTLVRKLIKLLARHNGEELEIVLSMLRAIVKDKDGTPHSAYMYQALGMCSHPYVDDYSWSEYKTPRNTGLFGQIYRLHEPLEHDSMKIIGVFEDKHKRGFRRMVLLMDLALELYQTSSDAKYIMNNSGKQERWCWWFMSVRRLNRMGIGDRARNDKVLAKMIECLGAARIRRYIDEGDFLIGDIVLYRTKEYRVSDVSTHYADPSYTITPTKDSQLLTHRNLSKYHLQDANKYEGVEPVADEVSRDEAVNAADANDMVEAVPVVPNAGGIQHVHGTPLVGEQKVESDYGDDSDSNDSTTVQHDTTSQIV